MRIPRSISQAFRIMFSSPFRTQNVRRLPQAMHAGVRPPVGAGS
jgi:hypothetical protein